MSDTAPTGYILIVEDDQDLAESMQTVLMRRGFRVDLALDGVTGLRQAGTETYDVVVTDLRLPGIDGMELLNGLRVQQPRLPVVLMTAHGTLETAIEATKAGAYDYVVKPFKTEELEGVLKSALTAKRERESAEEVRSQDTLEAAVIGRSPAMQRVFKELGRVAASDVIVLICGETGTGKELVARAIFEHSGRSKGPFIPVNCSAIPDSLLESELFGHERGAFTGAHAQRLGKFEQADGGTLFLDEIGDVPMPLQVKMLRVLQEKCIQRVGGSEELRVDVRIIAATNVDLEAAVAEGDYREDLFYRLNTVTIDLPPLRERHGDVRLLVDHFNKRAASDYKVEPAVIREASMQLLERQRWPGNVRQLENFMRRAVLACQGYAITEDYITKALKLNGEKHPTSTETVRAFLSKTLRAGRADHRSLYTTVMEAFEAELLRHVYNERGENKSHTASELGIARHTLRRKLQKYGIEELDDEC